VLALGIVSLMAEQLDLTIVYEPGEDGWIISSIPDVPLLRDDRVVSSQTWRPRRGHRTRDETRNEVEDQDDGRLLYIDASRSGVLLEVVKVSGLELVIHAMPAKCARQLSGCRARR